MKPEGSNGVGMRGQGKGGITLKTFKKKKRTNENRLLSTFPDVYTHTNIWNDLSYTEEAIPLAHKSEASK